MTKIIYTLFIDIPESELDYQHPYPGDTMSKTQRTKLLFNEHYQRLVDVKKDYADKIGVDFKIFEYDEKYKEYIKSFEKYPEITAYEIVNFYKIHLMYELSKQYDEILYLDFDVVPFTNQNFFEVWDLKKGICVKNNNDNIERMMSKKFNQLKIQEIKIPSSRDPRSKFFNASAMLIESNMSPKNDVINTGIVGINKEHLDKLDYFNDFRNTLDLMTKVKKEYDIYPENIVNSFGYDNETIFAYKLKTNNVSVRWLDEYWHFFLYDLPFISVKSKLIHVVDKNFDKVWKFIETHVAK